MTSEFLTQIKDIQSNREQEFQNKEMLEAINSLQKVSKNLNDKMFHLQYYLIITAIHSIVDSLRMSVQITPAMQAPAPAKNPGEMVFSDKAPVPLQNKDPEKKGPVKPGSHDDAIEKLRRKQRLFGRY